MRRTLLTLLFILSGCASAPSALIATVSPLEAHELVAAAVVLDIRTPDEFAEGHLEGAINLDFYAADFADQIGALDRDARYVVYCRSDNRSGQAMDLFRELGFAEVYEIDGGVGAWVGAGLPVVTTG